MLLREGARAGARVGSEAGGITDVRNGCEKQDTTTLIIVIDRSASRGLLAVIKLVFLEVLTQLLIIM